MHFLLKQAKAMKNLGNEESLNNKFKVING